MTPGSPPSVCSSGLKVDFYWAGCSDRQHIDAAVAACMKAIGADETWNMYLLADARNAFRRTLRRASQGELRPLKEVKRLHDPAVPIFEIRWQGIQAPQPSNVTRPIQSDAEDRGHGSSSAELQVRLYFAEPDPWPYTAVGLHAHVKDCEGTKDEIRAKQDEQIEVAARIYGDGFRLRWRITELQH